MKYIRGEKLELSIRKKMDEFASFDSFNECVFEKTSPFLSVCDLCFMHRPAWITAP